MMKSLTPSSAASKVLSHFHAVADHWSCSVRDGEVVGSWIDRTGEHPPPRYQVGCFKLEDSDEVVVFDTGDDEFVVLVVVEEWI